MPKHRDKTLGEMTPQQRKQAVDRAVAQLQRELTANAEQISAVMDFDEGGEA